jgi:glycosyltransferase involved in cell wall biosynthesis
MVWSKLTKKSRRILIFVTQHMRTGGIESHLMKFCENLASSGSKVDLLVLNSQMHASDEVHYRRICNSVVLGTGGGGLARTLWLLWNGIACRWRGYNAVYTNGQGNSIGLFAKLAVNGGRWVHHHHTSGDLQDQQLWPPAYMAAMKKADQLIACSSRNAGDISEALNRKVASVPCFSQAAEPRVNSDSREPLAFGYYGRLIPEKGIDTICQLAMDPTVTGIEFHLWGEGEAYPPGFFEQHPKVKFHGPFSGRAGLNQALGTLDAFLLISSHPEGLPICLLEAMSVGLPWLATDRGGISDIACDPASTRLLPSNVDYHQVRDAVMQLARDIREGRVSPENQRELYREKFSPEVLVERWKTTLGIDS